MPILQDFTLSQNETGALVVSMAPPTPIGGWTIQYNQTRRFGGTTIILKNLASGFSGASGITVTNSGTGVFQVQLNAGEMSGLDWGAYSYIIQRTDVDAETNISEGYRLCSP